VQPQTQDSNITVLLKKVQAGEQEAENPLFELVYRHLRQIARRAMAGERKDHTLQPTALVNEAFVALFKRNAVDWQNREHFYAQMAKTMRHKLIDYAKSHNAQKNQHLKLPLDHDLAATEDDPAELINIDEALTSLRSLDPELERIVELRFYGGLNEDEVAKELGMSARNVRRKWAAARGLMVGFLSRSRKPIS